MSDGLDTATLAKIHEAHMVNGIPPEHIRVPYRNIRHLLSLQAKVSPDKVFLIYYDADGTRTEFTYYQLNGLVHQVANFLHADLGVRRGDRVATIAFNHSDTVIIYFACWLIGAAVAPQNVTEDDPRIAYILRNSEAVVCLARHEYLERAEHIIHGKDEGLGAANIRQIVQVGGEAQAGYLHFWTEIGNRPDTFTTDDTPTLDDEALLVYTSGTTGAPKGVVLNQYNLLVDAQGIAQWQGITGNQRLMCVLPIHHVNGIVMTLVTPLFAGASTVLNRAYSSSVFWKRMADEQVHIVSVVPTLLQFSLEYAELQEQNGQSIWGEGITQTDLRHFRHLVCGAGTLAMSLVKSFEDKFCVPILHGYGLSETTCYSCFLPIDLSWAQHQHWLLEYGYPSIGCPIEPNEMAIFDAAGIGQQLPPGERGEICIRGHNVMKYYFKRPDANVETFKFSWFRSGDEGFYQVDEQGRMFFFITGRIKELINRGGVKFSPFDIEEVLLEIPGVKVGLAIAFKNTYYGEEVGAYVVPQEGTALTADAVIDYCRQKMTFDKSPKVVIFGSEIPVTTTGKYQRLRLQDHFAEWEQTQFRK
jgi:acyl-CoA synthetase (AMP-forming)/AMP-acid ligase II